MENDYYDLFLGILYVSSDLSKRQKRRLDTFINKMHEKYEKKANREFEKFLKTNLLQINMGMVHN